LFDLIAYTFIWDNPCQKTFFIYGNGGNGKGTFFNLLEAIWGKNMVDYKTWPELGTNIGRYSIMDKGIVLCNDIDDVYVKEPQALKALACCEPVSVKKLYSDTGLGLFHGKIISCGNVIPRVNDTSHGWERRLVLIPFDANFRDNPDIDMKDKITSEGVVEFIIYRALQRIPKVLEHKFKKPPLRVLLLKEEYRLENNNVAQFAEEYCNELSGKENAKALKAIYVMYERFCDDNGYKAFALRRFSKLMKEEGMKRTRHYSNTPVYYF
jgi:putative DNA primase/helicase